ncbi:hypothetical protein KW797_00070 [Candidatus Parcubacteria bacterium]|nr:hypothetical protein [Candidatus Parcubacteria bacterium]
MAIITSEWPDVYGNLEVDWGEKLSSLTRGNRQLAKVRNTTKKTGKATSRDNVGLAPDKDEGSPFNEESPQQGYAITWEQSGVGTSAKLTHEMFLFEATDDMSDVIQELAEAVVMRQEHDLAMRLRYAGSTTFTNVSNRSVNIATADTLALIHDAHTIPNSALTDDNDLDVLAFNKPAFLQARGRFRTFRNSKRLKINNLDPKTIITSDDSDMEAAVDEVIFSKGDPESARNRDNSLAKKGYSHLQIPQLQTDGAGLVDTTGAYYWFFADLKKTDLHLVVAEEAGMVMPKTIDMSDPNAPVTGDHLVTTRGTYAIYCRRYQWIVGSLATSVG